MEKENRTRPGIMDYVLAVSNMNMIPIRVLSIGIGSDESGHITTIVHLDVSGLPFEANLSGSWAERDELFGQLLIAFVSLIQISQKPLVCC
ncbi:MAG TPA: hypothetical protein VJI33_00195 [Candidatus Paceibacterota bacterium]